MKNFINIILQYSIFAISLCCVITLILIFGLTGSFIPLILLPFGMIALVMSLEQLK